ncbi:MAG: TolC family protein, partial [Cyclobacteriaceae bacterium]|nr:TolC family protein [Cyclobacteriaceae bacterium]
SSQYEKVLQEYSEAIRGMELNQQLSDLAEKMLRLEQTGFATGEADFDDVLDWKRKQLTYRLELEKAKTKARDSLYEIQFLTGR